MADESHNVVPFARKPWDNLVATLREKLEQAERGELRSFAYACEYANGDLGWHAFHDTGSTPLKLIGQIEVLKQRIIKRDGNIDDG